MISSFLYFSSEGWRTCFEIEFERLSSEIEHDAFAGAVESHRREEDLVFGIGPSDAQEISVLGEKNFSRREVEAAADRVARAVQRTERNSRPLVVIDLKEKLILE